MNITCAILLSVLIYVVKNPVCANYRGCYKEENEEEQWIREYLSL